MNKVPGYGNPHARIMIVGEAPAREEVDKGRPFMGRAGKELHMICKDAGVEFDQTYVTNASIYQVVGEKDTFFFKNGKFGGEPTAHFVESLTTLYADIARIKPNVIIALGNYALWALTGHGDIMRWRGSILWSPIAKVKIVPTIHPAALLRGKPDDSDKAQGGLWKMRTVVVWDIQRAGTEARSASFSPRRRELVIAPDGTALDSAVARLLAAPRINFDIETFGGTNLACIGFSDGDPEWAVCIPYNKSEITHALFKQILESDIPKEGQNLMYDCSMLDQIGIFPKNIVWDNMLASHLLYPQLPKGLDFFASVYTDIPYYKDEGKIWKMTMTSALLTQYWNYNAKDVCVSTETAIAQRSEIAERGLVSNMNRSMDLFVELRAATKKGVRCDVRKLFELMNEQIDLQVVAQAALTKEAGKEFNVRSWKQVGNVLVERGLVPAGRKVATDEKTLLDLAAKTNDPTLRGIVAVRKSATLLSRYYKVDNISADGRIRTSFNIAGTLGAKLSSSEPLWGPGTNLQNQPAKARQMFIPDEGYSFLECDQSQAEAILTAYLADDPLHMQAFRYGHDVHRLTACMISGLPLDQWMNIPKSAPIRQLGKTCNHAFNYDMGPETFMRTVNKDYDPDDPNSLKLDYSTARQIRDVYLAKRPALPGYWERVRSWLKRDNRTLRTFFGRECQFLDQWGDQLFKQAYSYIPSATVGEITNIGILNVANDEECRKADVQFLLQVHDSTLWQIPTENLLAIASRIMKLHEVPITVNNYQITIPIEGMWGPTWYKGNMENLGRSRKSTEDEYESEAI